MVYSMNFSILVEDTESRDKQAGKHMNKTKILRYRMSFAIAAVVVCMIAATCLTSAWRGTTDAVYAMDASSALTVGELLSNHYENRDDGKAFDRKTMDELLAALGGAGASLEDVSDLGTKDASYFRSQNANNDIIVTFGGFRWTATYLTQDRNGNTILSMWLTDSDDQAQWNKWS
mgnify:FL=1